MKKRTIALILTALMLCSCGKGDYRSATQALDQSDSYTVSAESEIHLSAPDTQTREIQESLSFTRRSMGYAAVVTKGEQVTRYYYQGGKIYTDSQEGKYVITGEYSEFLSGFGYAPPLDADLKDAEQKDGGWVYTATLSGDDYAQQLLALSTEFERMESVKFGDLTYTATVSGDRLTAYSYEVSFTAGDGTEGGVTFRATVGERAESVDFPSDEDGYISMDGMEDIGIGDDAFTEQVLYVIFESLYNPDGSKTENFDAYYRQFAEMYGEEFMQQIVEAADLFRDPGIED